MTVIVVMKVQNMAVLDINYYPTATVVEFP